MKKVDKKLKYYVDKAIKQHFALGAFNFYNMESFQSILQSCKETNSPAIVAVSESALKYMGENFVVGLFLAGKKEYPAIFLHLDHGKSYQICKKAIDLGFDSVMIDGSFLTFEENVKLTKKVVDYAHKKGVLVEGEIGQLKGVEDDVQSNKNIFTSPQEAFDFVKQTGVDMLAVAIGTSHGINKYLKNPTLRLDILSEIEKLLPNFPLVLHGASTVNQNLVKIYNSFGGEIKNALGVDEKLLKEAVNNHNIIKINTDTDIRLSFTSQIKKYLAEHQSEIDPRKYMETGKNQAIEIIREKIENILNSKEKK